MKIKLIFLAILVFSVLVAPISMKADTSINHLFLREFSRALYERDEKKLKTLVEPFVEIPEIRENTPIGGLATLPSPQISIPKGKYLFCFRFTGWKKKNDCNGC